MNLLPSAPYIVAMSSGRKRSQKLRKSAEKTLRRSQGGVVAKLDFTSCLSPQSAGPSPKGKVVIPDYIITLPGTRPSFKCKICHKTFLSRKWIGFHKYCQDGAGDKPFKCEFCPASFIRKQHLDTHLRVHTKERPYICDLCGKDYVQQGDLTRHLKSHQPPGADAPRLPCEKFHKTFKNEKSLKGHRKTHEKAQFKCAICGKILTRKASLENHIKLHEQRKEMAKKDGKL